MNKVILGLILAVCILGMALVMLNERLGRKNEYAGPATPETGYSQDGAAERVDVPDARAPRPPAELLEAVAGREAEEGRQALAPPAARHEPTPPDLQGSREEEALRLAAEVQLYPEGSQSVASELEQAGYPPRDGQAQKPAEKPAQKPASAPAEQQKPAQRPAPEPQRAVEKPAPPKPAVAAQPKAEAPRAEKPAANPPAQAEKPRQPAKAASRDINRFVIYARENGATVRVAGNGAMAWRSMTLENPPRVVVDMEGDWKFPAHPGVPKNDLVSNVRIGKADGNRTRVVIDLKEKPKSARVIGARAGDGFDVRVDK